MPITCDELRLRVQGFNLVESCDILRGQQMRLATPFKYPDGSNIDVFLATTPANLIDGQAYVLTDLGQTAAYLADLHVKAWTTERRKHFLADICDSLGVNNNNGQLEVVLPAAELNSLPTAIVRLSQACIRMADLAMTQRFRAANSFRDDVEEFISGIDLPYEPDVVIPGQFNNEVKIDFRIRGAAVLSLVQTLSTANTAFSHTLTNEVFRKWYDLRAKNDAQKITLFDATNDVFRQEDIERLNSVSNVFAFPGQEEEFRTAVAA